MGLLLTECLRCDVSFLTIREKKRGNEPPLQSSGWDCQVLCGGAGSICGWGLRSHAGGTVTERKIKCNQYFSNLPPKVQRE